MDDQLEIDGTFTFSGTSSSLYDYSCFDDQSNDGWIDGSEYVQNEDRWDKHQKLLWHFFNQPYDHENNIGPSQREGITETHIFLDRKESELSLVVTLGYLSLFAFLATLAFCFYSGSWPTMIAPSIFCLYILVRKSELDQVIGKASAENIRFKQELAFLLNQCKEIHEQMMTTKQVMKFFWHALSTLEEDLHLHYFGKNAKQASEDFADFYNRVNRSLSLSKKIDNHPAFPVLPSWGLLQSSSRSFDDERQATGLDAAQKDLGKKIATFRRFRDGTPVYRFWYLQFLFFGEKNLNVVSLSYDLLMETKYNVAVDTYQYTHITGTSYRAEDITHMLDERISWSLNIPSTLLQKVYRSQVKVISFSSASGTSFRCVLPDKEITQGLDDWFLYKNQVLANDGDNESDYVKTLKHKTAGNELINTLADHSVKELWNRCNLSSGLTEHTYLKEKTKQRSRRPFAGFSRPRPNLGISIPEELQN